MKLTNEIARQRRVVAVLVGSLLFACSACAQPAAAASAASDVSSIGKQLTGVWRLIHYVDTPAGAKAVHAFGEHPVGQFIFTADGNFSINIVRNPPDPAAVTTDIDPDACLPGWYCSYFGTYRLSETGRQWIAHVDGGNIPSYLGTLQTRTFELTGNLLVVSETYEEAGRTVRAERVLERVR